MMSNFKANLLREYELNDQITDLERQIRILRYTIKIRKQILNYGRWTKTGCKVESEEGDRFDQFLIAAQAVCEELSDSVTQIVILNKQEPSSHAPYTGIVYVDICK